MIRFILALFTSFKTVSKQPTIMRYIFIGCISFLITTFVQARDFLPASHYKQATVQKVYFDIAKAVLGSNLSSLPSIQIITKKKKVAAYIEEDRLITIDEAAYDICTSFNKDSLNALAVIIGHEFAHYYNKHKHYNCFKFPKKEDLRDKIEQEREADFYGLFSTYLAKYNTFNISSMLLEKIYAGYKLKEDLDGYPSLNIRQTINSSVEEKVQELICLYETANYLMAIGEYIPASHCYQNILNEYENVEILNNQAVSIILEEIKRVNYHKSSLIYPLELDLNSRLYKHIPYGTGETPTILSEKLFEAINILEIALKYNPEHPTTHLNLACAYSLQGLTANAKTQLQKVRRFTTSMAWKERSRILEAIIIAQSDKVEGIKAFKLLAEQASNTYTKEVASFNAKYLEGYRPNAQEITTIHVTDQIENTPIKVTRFNGEINISNQKRELYNLKWETKGKSSFSCLESLTNNDVIFLHKTTDLNNRTKKKIKIGSTAKEVQNSYLPEKPNTIAHKDGYFLVFPSNGLIFRIDKHDKVEEWAIYSR